jgi:nucleotide-binding universal stress UspA family protein
MDDRRTGRPVVAAVDGSDSALEAVRWAAREAARRHAPLRLVAAIGWTSPAQLGDPGFGPDPRAFALQHAQAHLARAVDAAVVAAPGTTPEAEALDGFPIPRLVDESRSARELVIGNRGLGGVAGLLLGSVAFALGAQGACPVVVVRGRTAAADGPVVVGVDGSPVSDAALAYAYEAAAVRRARLVAVHVWFDLNAGPITLPSLEWNVVAQEERAALAERLAGWREKYPDVEVEPLVKRDLPGQVLVEQSTRAQLVVVGSHGRGGVSGLVLGSVSHALAHRAGCPVAIVRGDATTGA